MDRKQFSDSLPTEGLLLMALAGLLLVTFVVALIVALAVAPEPSALRCLPPAASLLLALVPAAHLLHSYRTQPLVREKRDLQARLAASRRDIAQYEAILARAYQDHLRIDADLAAALATRDEKSDRDLSHIRYRYGATHQQEREELAAELQRLRHQYLSEGLGAARIRASQIHGVGPQTIKALAARGIHTAADVTAERVSALPGFGPAKTDLLVAWRRRVEAHLQNSLPAELPAAQTAALRDRYELVRARLDQDRDEVEACLERDLAALRAQGVADHQAADRRQADAHETLASLRPERDDLTAQLDAYRDVTPWTYVQSALRTLAPDRPRVRRLLPILILALLAATLVCQAAAAIRFLFPPTGEEPEATDPALEPADRRLLTAGAPATRPWPTPDAAATAVYESQMLGTALATAAVIQIVEGDIFNTAVDGEPVTVQYTDIDCPDAWNPPSPAAQRSPTATCAPPPVTPTAAAVTTTAAAPRGADREAADGHAPMHPGRGAGRRRPAGAYGGAGPALPASAGRVPAPRTPPAWTLRRGGG